MPLDLITINNFVNEKKLGERAFLFIYTILKNLGYVRDPDSPFLQNISPRMLAELYSHIHEYLYVREKKVKYVVKKRTNTNDSCLLDPNTLMLANDITSAYGGNKLF